MIQHDKTQFLDPVATIGRIIQLCFSDEGTKIRIHNHSVELDAPSYINTMRRTWYGDSRDDIRVLYPTVVRFIELFLMTKKRLINDKQKSTDEFNDDKCFEYLKKLAEYAILGITMLQDIYKYNNAVFTLQFFISILQHAVNGTYDRKLLPECIADFTNNNLIDDQKLQKIWDNKHIIELGITFEKCFKAKKDKDINLLTSHINSVDTLLNLHEVEFRKLILTDTTIKH